MVTEQAGKYFDKVSQLYGNGWKKLDGKWVDPINGDTHLSLYGAWQRHIKYKEKYNGSE